MTSAAIVEVNIWRAPLVPAALAFTSGLLVDRHASVPVAVSLLASALSVMAWLVSAHGRSGRLPLVYLILAGISFGAAWHHYRCGTIAADDIGNLVGDPPQPIALRGLLDDEPVRTPAVLDDPLRTRDRPEMAAAIVQVQSVKELNDWQAASGRVRLMGVPLEGLHAGDPIEVVGRLGAYPPPANPGEFDQAAYWADRGVRARLSVRPAPDAVTRLERGWPTTLGGWFAVIRGWGQQVLSDHLPPRTAGLAAALILGDGAPLAANEWEKYQRTGVIHVLAISGQHLVIFGGVLWWVLRRAGVRQRRAAAVVAVVLLAYALLTGGRPPAMRSAVMVCAACAGLIMRRRTLPANAFALAWIVVGLLNPADYFTGGCQLSFLAVAVLYWGARRLFDQPQDPLERLLEESRPPWQRLLLNGTKTLLQAYAVAGIIWLAVTPLVAAHYHLVPNVGFLLGPPLELLTSIALVAGFLLLLGVALALPIASLCAPFVDLPLAACEQLVNFGDRLWGGHIYVGDIPTWWLAVFYLGLLGVLTQPRLWQGWRWWGPAGLGWLCVGLIGAAAYLPADELRITFLAVGHGGCTVFQSPDGRTLLYDAGAITGPDVTKRQIAPFLWRQGIRRIDEVFLSHADLDHFNGLSDLLTRFSIGRVTCTPTFADKSSRAVRHTLADLERHGIVVRIASAGDRFAAGPVFFEVLHPPAEGPPGNENARSLVLRVLHAGHSILLTGDLEGAGLERVLRLPAEPVDVLMAPHHGSRASNTPELARWARPQLVIACQAPPPGARRRSEPYSPAGIRYLGTWPHGAVTIRSHPSGLIVDTFVTGEQFVVRGQGSRPSMRESIRR